jgi:hypothetical protein
MKPDSPLKPKTDQNSTVNGDVNDDAQVSLEIFPYELVPSKVYALVIPAGIFPYPPAADTFCVYGG